jgi:hypothetical protein
LRDQEDKSHRRGEEYESPWRKRGYRRSSTKKEHKRVTRRDMLVSLADKLERRIQRTPNAEKQMRLADQLFSYQQQLRKMDKEKE